MTSINYITSHFLIEKPFKNRVIVGPLSWNRLHVKADICLNQTFYW